MSIERLRGRVSRRYTVPATACAVLIAASGCGTGPAADAPAHVALDSALQDALENNASGESEQWEDPDTGDHGTIRPIRTFVSAAGIPCREYDVAIAEGDASDAWRDVACRDTDGVWKDGG